MAAGRDDWLQLRLCMACGHVGCCDSPSGLHATAHATSTDHPVVQSFEPGEAWAWCYTHEAMVPALADELLAAHA